MFRAQDFQIVKNWRQRKIAKQVRNGITPEGVTKEEIWAALSATKPKNVVEMFGFLSAVSHNSDGTLKKDYGLVSVKSVTSAFTNHLVRAMCSSVTDVCDFVFHKMGAGSTSETITHTALQGTVQDGAQTTDGHLVSTAGATANVYRTIGTLTAGSAYGCRQHGVFNASTGGIMLDRSVVTNIELNENDIVTWTYELTVTAGG